MIDDKLEIVHSGAYSPIFPLLPEREVERQIELDFQYKEENLGLTSKTGIYSPELCHGDSPREIYRIDGLSVFLRSALWSNRIRGGD